MKPRVILHVGPHKTGTTSIQFALISGGSFAYPTPEIYGPGHAHIAWRALGLNGFAPEADLLLDLVHSRISSETVVLSSEEFSRALEPESRPDSIVKLAEQFPVELVVTLTPLAGRLVSEAQTLIKHRASLDLTCITDLLGVLASRPGLRPNFLSRITEIAKWNAIHFVFVDKEHPTFLFEAFSKILGAKLEPGQRAVSNPRSSYVQVALLSLLNGLFPNSGMMALRKAAQRAANILAEELPEVRDLGYPSLPPEIATIVNSIWSEQRAYISALAGAGRASVFERTGTSTDVDEDQAGGNP